jgi:LysM repeat protein
MTSMLNHFIRAARVPLVITILLAFPASAWPQEQSSGTLAVPPSVPEQAAAEAGAPAPAAAAEQPGTYTIREGDTLWDISNAHYRDPFLWPLIWKSNTFIDNPDLIYPGKTLVIPSLAPVERAMAAPAAPAEVKEQAPPAPPAVAAAPPAAEPEDH